MRMIISLPKSGSAAPPARGIMYRPDQSADNPTGTPLNRAAFFDMKANVKIYGGFARTEGPSDFNLRNPAANITILTGDIGTQNTTTDNCYTVVKCTASGATNFNCILDGVTITGGFANDGAGQDSGGGVRITNGAAPRLHQCRIANNFAGTLGNTTSGGPGVYVNASSPVLTRCTIESNSMVLAPPPSPHTRGRLTPSLKVQACKKMFHVNVSHS